MKKFVRQIHKTETPTIPLATTVFAAILFFGLIFVTSAFAADCTVSKEFHLKRPQVLAGILEDPNDVPLPGIRLELLKRKRVVQHLRSNNDGRYDFGKLTAGKYRIRVRYGDDNFCAPKVQCGNQGCRVDPRLTLNPEKAVLDGAGPRQLPPFFR